MLMEPFHQERLGPDRRWSQREESPWSLPVLRCSHHKMEGSGGGNGGAEAAPDAGSILERGAAAKLAAQMANVHNGSERRA